MAYSTYSSPDRSQLQLIKWKMTYLKVQTTNPRKMKKKNINVWVHSVPKICQHRNKYIWIQLFDLLFKYKYLQAS